MVKRVFEIAAGVNKASVENIDGCTEAQKQLLFLDALKATYIKYGLNHAKYAVAAIVSKGDYEYITNGETNYLYRIHLEQNVSSNEILKYIHQTVLRYKPNFNATNIGELIDSFMNIMFLDDVILKFEDICLVTLENHGSQWLFDALLRLFYEGRNVGFSRFLGNDEEINYRAELSKISKDECIRAMEAQLNYAGIDYSGCNLRQFISLYVNSLSESLYEHVGNTVKSNF